MPYREMKSSKFISLFIGFTLLIISLIWLQLIQQHHADREAAISVSIQRNSNLAVALEQYTIRTIRNVDAVLQMIKREYESEGAAINISKKLAEYSLDYDFFNEVAIVDDSGKIIASSKSVEQHAAFNYANRPSFLFHSTTPAGNLHISKPIMSLTLKRSVIILSRRISKPDGHFGGIVAIQIDPSTFTRFYADAQLRTYDIISLIAPDGITYARRTGAIESHSENIRKSPLFGHVKQRPVGDYFSKDAIRGIPTYFSFRKLQNYPIIATVGTSETDVLASFRDRVKRDYIFATLISLLILLFAVLSCIALLHRKRIIKKVKESEIKYRSIVENSHDVILLVDTYAHIKACNLAACKAFRMNEATLLQKTLADLVAAPASNSDNIITQALTTLTFEGELLFVRTDGTLFTGEMVSTLHTDTTGKKSITVIIRDVTERKRMATKLEKEQKRFQQMLTRQVILAQEREREDIGRELHDNVNQVLTTVKLYLELANSNTEMSAALLPKSIELVKESINEIRCLSHSLSAPTLGTNSIIDSICTLIDSVTPSAQFSIHFEYSTFSKDLSKEQKLALYRIVQEQLNNITKHANATTVTILLGQSDQDTNLTIQDNGVGFKTDALRTGIGLNNIISRTKAFEGSVQLQAQPGSGCTLIVSLPMTVTTSID